MPLDHGRPRMLSEDEVVDCVERCRSHRLGCWPSCCVGIAWLRLLRSQGLPKSGRTKMTGARIDVFLKVAAFIKQS